MNDVRLHESNRIAHEAARAALEYRRMMSQTAVEYSEELYGRTVRARRRLETALNAYEKHDEGSE